MARKPNANARRKKKLKEEQQRKEQTRHTASERLDHTDVAGGDAASVDVETGALEFQ